MSVISLLVTDEEIKQKPRDIGIMLRKLFLPFGGAEVYFDAGRTVFLLDLLLVALLHQLHHIGRRFQDAAFAVL